MPEEWEHFSPHHSFMSNAFTYLDIQGGEIAVKVFGIIDVRFPAHWANHVSDVFVPYNNGEVLLETTTTYGTLARCQRLHLSKNRGWERVRMYLNMPLMMQNSQVYTLLCGKTERQIGHSFANTLLINSLSWDSRTACTTSSSEYGALCSISNDSASSQRPQLGRSYTASSLRHIRCKKEREIANKVHISYQQCVSYTFYIIMKKKTLLILKGMYRCFITVLCVHSL